ncbi:MAG TPA: alpha/beta hydrolase [Caulobacteraceae bacterium]|nr:alpha/beta hydrolase [Caulobacteraceae bacterium]
MSDLLASIVGAGSAPGQGADFVALPSLARRLGVEFDDTTPPRHIALAGAGGLKLHALDWGGEGPPALFLHGGRLTAQTWDYVCLGLRGTVRAVALDLRGHGDSDRAADYAFESHVADVGAALDDLGWSEAHLVGMSYGGLIATHFAAGSPHRVASLVTVDVGPGVLFEGTARMRSFFARIDPGEGPEAVIESAMQTSPLRDRERIAYRMAAMMRRRDDGAWAWAFDERRAVDYPAVLAKAEEMAAAAERLSSPCLVVRGARSPVFPEEAAARFAGAFRDGAWAVVPDAGHNVQEDNPAGLLAALARFWSTRRG